MGAHHSKTPSPAAPASPNTTLQATSPSRACAEAKFYETPPVQSGVSKSSSSRMQGTMLSHTCLRRRRRRGRKGGKQLHRLPVALSVGSNGINDGDGDDSVALRVGGKLVGESVLVYWQKISAWVECEVMQYGGVEGAMRGMHRVRYADGLHEWMTLRQFRLLVSAKRFARAIGMKKTTHERGGRDGNGGDEST